jgi:hypothetical protein
MSSEAPTKMQLSELYENGKHRRYSLLFSINGGAFAIAKLLAGEGQHDGAVLGALSLKELSAGMALMTVVMVIDIYAFGEKMRQNLPNAFGPVGKAVLLLLGALTTLGWVIVGFGKA